MSDRKSRKEELLAAARERLKAEQAARKDGRNDTDSDDAPDRQIMYRGQVLRNSGGATPGSGLGSKRPQASQSTADEARATLQKIKELYQDGLISRAEAEAQRAKILDEI